MGKKASIGLLGVVLAGLAFFFGFAYNDIPELAGKKYLMPNKYRTHLRSQVYKVWYFPKWNKVGQKRPMGEVDVQEMEGYLNDLPQVFLEGAGEEKREVLIRRFKPPTAVGKGYKFAMQVGEFNIEESGDYFLSSSREGSSDKFVIALIPPLGDSKKMTGKTPFRTYFDDNLVTQ